MAEAYNKGNGPQGFSPEERSINMREEKIFSFLTFFANHPILVVICIVFTLCDIVLLTCVIYDRIQRKETTELRSSYNEILKNKEELDGQLKGMRDSYERLSSNFNHTETMYKELEKRTSELQTKLDSRVASLSADLSSCQSTNLDFISQIAAKESSSVSMKNKIYEYELMTTSFKKLLAPQLILEPTWIKTAEVLTAFDGNCEIFIDEASDKNPCLKNQATSISLKIENSKSVLCVQIDQPESFKYKGKKYFICLLGVKEEEQSRHYLVSILKEPQKYDKTVAR